MTWTGMYRRKKRRGGPLVRSLASRARRSDDSGATLILALIFITVVSIVIAAILSFVDTSMRTTVAVRGQAASAAAADGAAQIAINQLRKGTYSGGSCAGSMPALDGFFPSGATTYSATVTCEQDTTDSEADSGLYYGSANKPGNAILTLDPPTVTAEDGLNVNAGGNNVILAGGDIFSNSTISASKNLHTTGSIKARGTCTGTLTSTPAPVCNYGGPAVVDPGYDAPSTPTSTPAPPACRGAKKVVTFSPGLYTNLTALNDLTGSCNNATFYFPAGVYYFDLGGLWTIDTGVLVGGHATLTDGVTPNLPGVCQSPIPPNPLPVGWTKPSAGNGVEFVFGGTTQLKVSKGQMELCGSYSATAPPIALYGLKEDLKQGSTVIVKKQSGCVVSVGGCPVLSSDNSPNSNLFIHGTAYVPLAQLKIKLNNNTGQAFTGGVIARSFYLDATGSPDYSGNEVIGVPEDSLGIGLRTVVYLAVYVCTGTPPCSTSGSPQLKVKVGIIDPSGAAVAGQRQMTVYNWSVQRK